MQLWNEEAYHQGPNKVFWIEICFFDFNRFEIRIARDPTNNLELESCKQSDSSPLHYIDGKKNKFDFPNRHDFCKMINYVSDLYMKLYKLKHKD